MNPIRTISQYGYKFIYRYKLHKQLIYIYNEGNRILHDTWSITYRISRDRKCRLNTVSHTLWYVIQCSNDNSSYIIWEHTLLTMIFNLLYKVNTRVNLHSSFWDIFWVTFPHYMNSNSACLYFYSIHSVVSHIYIYIYRDKHLHVYI